MGDTDDKLTWTRIEPTLTQKVWYRTIIEKTIELPNGVKKSFTTINPDDSGGAGCIAITKDNKVIVAKQFRPAQEKLMYEIPGGGIEPGEDPEVTAVRELTEETGYVPGKVKFLGNHVRDE